MRRTIVKWPVLRWAALRWAAVGAVGMVAVAGCGQSGPSWLRPGAAALYDNGRISATQLASEATNLSAGYRTYQGKLKSQLTYRPADIPRQTISWMLRIATIEQLARNEHISVTPAQVQQAHDTYVRLLAQQGATLPEFAVSLGLPPDMLPQFAQLIAIQAALERRLDHGTAPAQGTSAFNQLNLMISHLQCVAAKGLNIKVNPQYGAFDYASFQVVPLTGELASGQSAAQAAALAPRC